MTQEDPSRKTPSPKGHSDTRLEKARRDFAEALERGESPRIEDSLGDASGAERERLLEKLLQDKVSALLELRPSAERERLLGDVISRVIVSHP